MPKVQDGILGSGEERAMTNKCVRCGYFEFVEGLQTHHMDHNHYNNKPNNRVILCANCHCALHRGRWELEEIDLTTPPKSNIQKEKRIMGYIEHFKKYSHEAIKEGDHERATKIQADIDALYAKI